MVEKGEGEGRTEVRNGEEKKFHTLPSDCVTNVFSPMRKGWWGKTNREQGDGWI